MGFGYSGHDRMNNNILNIQYKPIDLGSDLNSVRSKLDTLKFDSNITILALQPGVGKTFKLKNFLTKNKKWVLTVPNHNLIENEYEEIGKIEDVKHWRSFKDSCQQYKNGNKFVKMLYDDYQISTSIICFKSCKSSQRKQCPYQKQFKANEVVTVSAYYNTPRFYEEDKFKFDIA